MSSLDADALIARNAVQLRALVAAASLDAERGRVRSAAAKLQSAARFASSNHPGEFWNSAWDTVAARLAERVPAWDLGSGSVEVGGHVVHILTQAYEIGGHTRLVARWIAADSNHMHSVVLTGQQGLPVPSELAAAVAAAHGTIIDLSRSLSDLMDRAAMLRSIVWGGPSAVILHIHPYDVVPSLALRNVDVPIAFLNHADHLFNVGTEVADTVVDIRPAGRQLSLRARRVSVDRSALLPIPLEKPRSLDRANIRERLGLKNEDVLLIAIASGYKFGTAAPHHFVDIHRKLLEANTHVVLRVAGPEPRGRWVELARATGGRARAIGRIRDVTELYAAADIYVDSLPFSSLTSLLDAALRGTPTIALSGPRTGTVLSADDVSLLENVTQFREPEKYLQELQRLISDARCRHDVGVVQRQAVEASHLTPGWLTDLNKLYGQLDGAAAPDPSSLLPGMLSDDVLAWLNRELVQFQLVSGLSEPAWLAKIRDAPYMSPRDRLVAFSEVPRSERQHSLSFLLPDATRSWIKRTMRWLANFGLSLLRSPMVVL